MTDIPVETGGIKRIRTTKTTMDKPIPSMGLRNRLQRSKPALS